MQSLFVHSLDLPKVSCDNDGDCVFRCVALPRTFLILEDGMGLLEELLKTAVRDGDITVNVSFEAEDLIMIAEGKCYNILSQIRDIVRDNSIDDPECFMKIEKLVCLFEKEGIGAGCRHDF